VETDVDNDAHDDGYKWRKYGQKLVKGSYNPRSYYRCSEEGCGVKKHTERKDSKIVSTYDGVHTHPAPYSSGANDMHVTERFSILVDFILETKEEKEVHI
jgi:WRKY transcription factor 33